MSLPHWPGCWLSTLALPVLLIAMAGCATGQSYTYVATPPTDRLPPGTVRLEATVESCEPEGDEAYRCQLRANRVIAYGSGGRVTPPDTPLEATFGHTPLGIERAPEVGARVDALIETVPTMGPDPTHRVTRLFNYTSPR